MDSKNSIILFDKFTDDVVRDKKYPIQITVDGEERKLSLNCFLVRQCRKVFADPKLAPPLDTLIQPMRRIARSRIGLPGEIDLSGSYARLQSRRALRKLS